MSAQRSHFFVAFIHDIVIRFEVCQRGGRISACKPGLPFGFLHNAMSRSSRTSKPVFIIDLTTLAARSTGASFALPVLPLLLQWHTLAGQSLTSKQSSLALGLRYLPAAYVRPWCTQLSDSAIAILHIVVIQRASSTEPSTEILATRASTQNTWCARCRPVLYIRRMLPCEVHSRSLMQCSVMLIWFRRL
jgi:hypothetical protein